MRWVQVVQLPQHAALPEVGDDVMKKNVMVMLLTGILLICASLALYCWTKIPETGIPGVVGLLLSIGAFDALVGTKQFIKVFIIILVAMGAAGLLYIGTLRINLGMDSLDDPSIAHYAEVGVMYVHLGYLLLIAVAVLITKHVVMWQMSAAAKGRNETIERWTEDEKETE